MKNTDFMVELDKFDCLPQVAELASGKYDMDWCVFYINNIPYFIKWGEAYNIISMNLHDAGTVFTSAVLYKTIPGTDVNIAFYCGNEIVFRAPCDVPLPKI